MALDYDSYVTKKKLKGKTPLSREEWEKKVVAKEESAEEGTLVAAVKAVENVLEDVLPKIGIRVPKGGAITAPEQKAARKIVSGINLLLGHSTDVEVITAIKKARTAMASLNKGMEVDLADIVDNLRSGLRKLKKGGLADEVIEALDEAKEAVDILEAEVKKRV